MFTSPHRLHLFDTAGQKWGQAADLSGVGRLLRTAPGWLAAATDRQILLYDLRHNTHRRLDVSLVELTHLAIRPDDFGLALVQERDRIGRMTVSNRWVWKQELRSPIEDVAIGPYSFVAVTTHGGELVVFDAAGEFTSTFTFDPTDPPLLIEAPADSPPQVAWITFTRRAQVLRGHDLRGQVLWERPTPWEGWALYRLPQLVVATAADGRALACAGSGEPGRAVELNRRRQRPLLQRPGRPPAPRQQARRASDLLGLRRPCALARVVNQPPGPMACSSSGVALMLGRSLAWFQDESDLAS